MLEALVRKTEVIQQAARLRRPGHREADHGPAGGGRHRPGPGQGARQGDRGGDRCRAARRARGRKWMTRKRRATSGCSRSRRPAQVARGFARARRRRRRRSPARRRRRLDARRLVARPRARRTVGDVATFNFDPADPAFAKEAGWQDTFDDLRVRPRKRGERINEWRKRVPIRAIAFEPPRLPDGRDAPDVVQVHLEHRLVRRLLSRFISQGFQAGLSRFSLIEGPGAQPRVVLMGRLAVYGAGAARLHEEIIPVTAIWTEAERERKPLRPLGESGEERTLNQLEEAAAQRPRGAEDGGRARAGAGRARYRRPLADAGAPRRRALAEVKIQLQARRDRGASLRPAGPVSASGSPGVRRRSRAPPPRRRTRAPRTGRRRAVRPTAPADRIAPAGAVATRSDAHQSIHWRQPAAGGMRRSPSPIISARRPRPLLVSSNGRS